MIVIIEYQNRKMIEHFKHKLFRYWFCILKWKIKGAEIETLKEKEIRY